MIAALIYPHQLFPDTSWLRGVDRIYLVEDPLFFNQYPFHRQKLMLHRASMQWYADRLRKKKWKVQTIEAAQMKTSSDIARFDGGWTNAPGAGTSESRFAGIQIGSNNGEMTIASNSKLNIFVDGVAILVESGAGATRHVHNGDLLLLIEADGDLVEPLDERVA